MEVRIATTNDLPFLRALYAHDDVWPHIKDDFTPESIRDFVADIVFTDPSSFILTDGKSGAFQLKKMNGTMFEVHTSILPEYRGANGIEFGQAAIDWMFDNTRCEQILSFIPIHNRAAVLYALKCGFRKICVIYKSIKIDGAFVDQYLVGRAK